MVIMERQDVFALLSPARCTDLMEETLVGLEQGRGKQYLRGVTMLPSQDILGFMPAYLDEEFFGAKVITVFHRNREAGYPSHQGSVLLFDTPHGSLQAMVDDVATLEEHGLEVTYPDREEMKAAGGGVIDEYCAEYPEFDDVMTKIEALQEEYRANNVSTADTAA